MATALIFSTDENFAPLAKGLVLSILSQDKAQAEFALNLIDIGCSSDTLAWMKERGVNVNHFDRNRFIKRVKADLKPYQNSQLCRPFLPDIVSGFDTYLWCDSDIWIQKIGSLRHYRDLAISNIFNIPISPLVDISYQYFYNDCTEFSIYNHIWYKDSYGETVANTYSKRAILSSGIFALSEKSPFWKRWGNELNFIMQRNFEQHTSLHLAEQTALNYLAYSDDRFIPVSALHNYNCHIGKPKRNSHDFIVVDIPPYPEIGVVHLTHTGKMIKTYIDRGLLFDNGKYLTTAELERLKMIAHY